MEPREERRSPAAVLGSKRIGLIVPPERLSSAIQNEINGELYPLLSIMP
jgi:hypothetical protein